MKHPALQQYIRLLLAQRRIVNNNLKDNLELKLKIEKFLEKLDDLIQIGNEFKVVEPINTDIRIEAEETLNTVNIDIEIATLERQTLDDKISSLTTL